MSQISTKSAKNGPKLVENTCLSIQRTVFGIPRYRLYKYSFAAAWFLTLDRFICPKYYCTKYSPFLHYLLWISPKMDFSFLNILMGDTCHALHGTSSLNCRQIHIFEIRESKGPREWEAGASFFGYSASFCYEEQSDSRALHSRANDVIGSSQPGLGLSRSSSTVQPPTLSSPAFVPPPIPDYYPNYWRQSTWLSLLIWQAIHVAKCIHFYEILQVRRGIIWCSIPVAFFFFFSLSDVYCLSFYCVFPKNASLKLFCSLL